MTETPKTYVMAVVVEADDVEAAHTDLEQILFDADGPKRTVYLSNAHEIGGPGLDGYTTSISEHFGQMVLEISSYEQRFNVEVGGASTPWMTGYDLSYPEAVEHANAQGDELQRQGWATDRGWASRDNLYAIYATKYGQAQTIQVVRDQA